MLVPTYALPPKQVGVKRHAEIQINSRNSIKYLNQFENA